MTTSTPPWVPPGGIRAQLCGGNTVGATLREATARADGYRHVDTPRMIARLQELGANTHLYCIWDSAVDWDDLRLEFAPAAEAAGIDVWVYLVPPNETDLNGGRASRPYLLDYLAWARAIAELSREHPNVKAWGIDDFELAQNQDTFTPAYVSQMREVAREISRDLGFYICTYLHAATDADFLAKYGRFLDFVLFPFLDGWNANTQVAETVGQDLDAIRAAVRPWGIGIVLLVYSGRWLDAWLEPTEGYVSSAVGTGLDYAADGRISGVVAYGLQLDDAPTVTSSNKAMYGNGRLSLLVPSVRTAEGSYAEASQLVEVVPGLTRYELSFWHNETVAPERIGTRGKHLKQVLIDDRVVWSEDVMGRGFTLWQQGSPLHGPIDVTDFVRGRATVKLAFRLLQARGGDEIFPIDVSFDHIETIGLTVRDPGFESPGGWTLTKSHGAPLAAVDVFVPDRPRRIFDTVATEFGKAAARHQVE